MHSTDRADAARPSALEGSGAAARVPGSTLPQRLLLATDLSEASEPATAWAMDLALLTGAPLIILSVIGPRDRRLPGSRTEARLDQVRELRQAAAVDLVAQGQRIGVPVSFLIWSGDPGESIVAAAEAEAADLIVLGTHGRGALGRLVIGSVSDYVVRHAACAVVVVREPAA